MEITGLILFVYGLITILFLLRFRSLVHPAYFVVVWWCFWMVIATINWIGMETPRLETWLLFLTMILSFSAGSLIPMPVFRIAPLQENEWVEKWNCRMFKVFAILSLPVLTYYFWRSRQIIAGLPSGVSRSALINSENGDNLITGTNFIRNLLEIAIAGPCLYFSFFTVIYFLRNRQYLLPFGTALFTVMYQSFELGRSQIYRLMLLMLMLSLIVWKRMTSREKMRLIGAVTVMCFGLLVTMSLASAERNENKVNHDFSDSLTEFVSYHTSGFTLFDIACQDRASPLNGEPGYGRTLLAGMDFMVMNALRPLFPGIPSYRSTYLDYTDTYMDIGVKYGDGQTAWFNSYFTLLFPLYKDGRIFFVIIIPLALGYFCTRWYVRWQVGGGDLELALSTFVAINMIMGLFQSTTERTYTFVAFFLLLGMSGAVKKIRRMRRHPHAA